MHFSSGSIGSAESASPTGSVKSYHSNSAPYESDSSHTSNTVSSLDNHSTCSAGSSHSPSVSRKPSSSSLSSGHHQYHHHPQSHHHHHHQVQHQAQHQVPHQAPQTGEENILKTHQEGGNRKRYQQSTKADQKSIETVFLIAICHQCGNKWQSKTLSILIFDLRSSIVLVFSIASYPVWKRCSILASSLEKEEFNPQSHRKKICITDCYTV